MENTILNAKQSENAKLRKAKKESRLQAKEGKQVCNEKTLAKNLANTRQKLLNIQYTETIDCVAMLKKHVNFCEKHRKTALCGFDAKAIKSVSEKLDLLAFVDERGFNAVSCLTYIIGVLDKQRKETIKRLEKETKKQSK